MLDQRSHVLSPPQRRLVQLTPRKSATASQASVTATPKVPVIVTKSVQQPRTPVLPRKQTQQVYNSAYFAGLTQKKTLQTKLQRIPQTSGTSNHHNNSAQVPASSVVQESSSKVDNSKVHKKMQFAFALAGIAVFVLGIGVSVTSFRTNNQVLAQAQAASQTQNTEDENAGDNPNEDPLDQNAVTNYRVAPDAPKRITIPKLSVNARTLHLGVKSNSELKTPTNVFDTGWYDASAKPGQPGAMLIDGHVHGPTKPGVFYGLKKLTKDDVINVERGDGKIVAYKVVKTQIYDAEQTDMNAAMAPVVPGQPGLNLITCTGKLDKKTNLYNERLIVFATLVM